MTATTNSDVRTGSDAFLRFALRLDAVITGLGGVAGLALAPWIAELSGTTTAFEYTLGAAFVAYGVVVYGLSTTRRVRGPGVAVAIANVLYAVASLIAVLAGVWPLTTAGVVATLGCGVFTLVMADLQYLGLRRLAQ